MADFIRKSVLASLGLVEVTRERVKEAVDKLVDRGKVDKQHAASIIDEMVKRGEEESKRFTGAVEKGISSALKRAHIVTKEEFQELTNRVEKLEKTIEDLSKK